MSSTIGVGVIGLGFMGRTHIGAYDAARRAGMPCRLHAVCDNNLERLAGGSEVIGNIDTSTSERLFDPDEVRGYTEVADLLSDPGVQVVSVCTHTDTHVDIAIRALEAGKHVLVEKPVAIRSEDVGRLAEVAARCDTLCMPAMCVRFWPGWRWLKERIDAGDLGAVRSARFERLGEKPSWGEHFYTDAERCGSALVDLHIHDADFVRWCFGEPAAVLSVGTMAHVTTVYQYPDGPDQVIAEGGWIATPGFPFRMRYRVHFDAATAEFDLAAESPLVLIRDGRIEPVPLEDTTGYEGEVRHLVSAVAEGHGLDTTIGEAHGVARLLELERRSLETGEVVSTAG